MVAWDHQDTGSVISVQLRNPLSNAPGGTIYLAIFSAVSNWDTAVQILDLGGQNGGTKGGYCAYIHTPNKDVSQLHREPLSAKLGTFNSAPNTATPTATVQAAMDFADEWLTTHTCADKLPNTVNVGLISEWTSGNGDLPECPTIPMLKT